MVALSVEVLLQEAIFERLKNIYNLDIRTRTKEDLLCSISTLIKERYVDGLDPQILKAIDANIITLTKALEQEQFNK